MFAKYPQLGPTGRFPTGAKVDADDKGELTMGLRYNPILKLVRVDFGVPVASLSLTRSQAVALVETLTLLVGP